MSTSHEKALSVQEQLKAMGFGNPARRKGTATHYANGKPKVAGKTQKQIKEEAPKVGSGAGLREYKTDTSHAPPNKQKWNASHMFGWAGRVGEARRRNQKGEGDKGYREDYR